MFNENIHHKWPFSIAMLVYQRVFRYHRFTKRLIKSLVLEGMHDPKSRTSGCQLLQSEIRLFSGKLEKPKNLIEIDRWFE
jgi:hypothetical protein